MLFAAGHAKNDIPSVLNSYQAQNPEMEVIYGRELGVDLKMIRAAGERIEEAWQKRVATCRAKKRFWLSSGAVLLTQMQTQMLPKLCVCFGKVWVLDGVKSPIPA